MASIYCAEKPPFFVALQWNGSNQQEVHDFVFHCQPNMERNVLGETVDDDDTLTIYVQCVGVQPIPLQGWVVFGPLWSQWQPDSRTYPPSVYTNAQFEARFTSYSS